MNIGEQVGYQLANFFNKTEPKSTTEAVITMIAGVLLFLTGVISVSATPYMAWAASVGLLIWCYGLWHFLSIGTYRHDEEFDEWIAEAHCGLDAIEKELYEIKILHDENIKEHRRTPGYESYNMGDDYIGDLTWV